MTLTLNRARAAGSISLFITENPVLHSDNSSENTALRTGSSVFVGSNYLLFASFYCRSSNGNCVCLFSKHNSIIDLVAVNIE
jgi:hypothetical protein